MKKYTVITGLILIAFCFTACEGAYVASEPTYVETVRPPQPSPSHIWIDGDWQYNRPQHSYYKKEGHWDMPRQGRNYQQGHWESNKKGHHWINGNWH